MTWQDVLGVRWTWRPTRAVRVVVATAATVVIVGSLLFTLVYLCLWLGVGWAAVLVAAALLFLWVAEKWWIVLDPENLLLWLKFVPGMWHWVHEDDDELQLRTPGLTIDVPTEQRTNPSITQERWSPRPW